jgi:hypothetical protein
VWLHRNPRDVAIRECLLTGATRRYADHVGIHYVLCSKLRTFAYEELEFFLPQYVPSISYMIRRFRRALDAAAAYPIGDM